MTRADARRIRQLLATVTAAGESTTRGEHITNAPNSTTGDNSTNSDNSTTGDDGDNGAGTSEPTAMQQAIDAIDGPG